MMQIIQYWDTVRFMLLYVSQKHDHENFVSFSRQICGVKLI